MRTGSICCFHSKKLRSSSFSETTCVKVVEAVGGTIGGGGDGGAGGGGTDRSGGPRTGEGSGGRTGEEGTSGSREEGGVCIAMAKIENQARDTMKKFDKRERMDIRRERTREM